MRFILFFVSVILFSCANTTESPKKTITYTLSAEGFEVATTTKYDDFNDNDLLIYLTLDSDKRNTVTRDNQNSATFDDVLKFQNKTIEVEETEAFGYVNAKFTLYDEDDGLFGGSNDTICEVTLKLAVPGTSHENLPLSCQNGTTFKVLKLYTISP